MPHELLQSLAGYKNIVFDCDGVILNSNKIKSHAFYSSALSWGSEAASCLLSYHLQNGGISRYEKFQYFFDVIIPSCSYLDQGYELNTLVQLYATQVADELLKCQMTHALPYLRELTSSASWLVASGSDQSELRSIFMQRNISHFFDAGIYGSPDDKYKIVANSLSEDDCANSLFIGDSIYDFKVSKYYGMDFLFVCDWTDITGWRTVVRNYNMTHIDSLDSLLT